MALGYTLPFPHPLLAVAANPEHLLASGSITPASASAVTWPSLCVFESLHSLLVRTLVPGLETILTQYDFS